jgi:hypothetical protein
MSSRRYAIRGGASPAATPGTRSENPRRAPRSSLQDRSLSIILPILLPALLAVFVPSSEAAEDYLLMPRAELLSLPTSGTPWTALKTVADASWGAPNLCDQDARHGTEALAGALVYARTGDSSYYSKTRNAVLAAIGTERSDCTVLSIGRQLGAYVLAADFIRLGGSDDDRFRSWLSSMRTRIFTGHSRWQTIVGTHEDSANNWGAFAGAARIAASLYLGDGADVQRAAAVLRGFLGNRDAWSSFRGQGDTNDLLTDKIREFACDPSPTGFVPVNPDCSRLGINLDGAIVNDVSRDDVGLVWPVGPTGIGYTLESLQGLIFQTELLYRNGYPGAWSWSNSALQRVARLVSRNGLAGGTSWNTAQVNLHVPWLLNFRYGMSLPTRPAGYGRTLGYTDWLYGARTGGDPATQPPAPTPAPTAAPMPTQPPAATPAPTTAPTQAPAPTPAPTDATSPDQVLFRSASFAVSASGALTLVRPAGVASGDLLIAVVDASGSQNRKISAPTGWKLVRRDFFARSVIKAVFVRTARPGEAASYTFTVTREGAANAMIVALVGADPNNPIVDSSALGSRSSTSIVGPSVAAAEPRDYLIGLYAIGVGTTVQAPSGMTFRGGDQGSAALPLTSIIATQVVGAGATGDRTARALEPGDNIGQLLLIRPG